VKTGFSNSQQTCRTNHRKRQTILADLLRNAMAQKGCFANDDDDDDDGGGEYM
jgi:hypothetical protein